MMQQQMQSNKTGVISLPENMERLSALAEQTKSDTVIYEGGFYIPAVILFFIVFSFFLAVQSITTGPLVSIVFFTFTGVFALLVFYRLMRVRKIPFFTLTPRGLVCSVFQTPLPWDGIRDFTIKAADSNIYNFIVTMEFDIDERFLPVRNDVCRSASKYDPENKKLIISGMNFHGAVNRDSLTDLLNAYRLAAL